MTKNRCIQQPDPFFMVAAKAMTNVLLCMTIEVVLIHWFLLMVDAEAATDVSLCRTKDLSIVSDITQC